jgi:hypothetical protein
MDARPAGQAQRIADSLERYGEFLREVKKEQEEKGVGSAITDEMLDNIVERVLGTDPREAEQTDESADRRAPAASNRASA